MSSIDVVGCQLGISTNSLIRIAIFPIGKINASTFKKFVSMIQACDSKPIKSLTRFRDDNLKSPFQKQDWARSVLKFQFVEETSINTGYSDFHQYRNVHGVIGIMSCLSEESVATGFTKYKKQKLQVYGKNIVGRCFAVEQDPETTAPEDEELVVIPNQDESHVGFHIDYLFSDLARQVLIRFEKIVSNPAAYFNELSNSFLMSSPTGMFPSASSFNSKKMTPSKSRNDLAIASQPTSTQPNAPSSTGTSQSDEKNLQNMKLFADCALLISDYEDALSTYTEISNICKQQMANSSVAVGSINYALYQAGSSEGIATITFVKNKVAIREVDSTIIQQIYDLLHEALDSYEKSKKKDLLVECYIKTAVFISTYCDKKKRKEALDCLSKAVQAAVTLTTQERIVVSGFAAKICKQMKSKRKFGFFLRHVAQLHHDLCNQGVSIRLGAQFLDAYNIPLELTPTIEWKVKKNYKLKGWNTIQMDIIRSMIDFAQSMSPPDYSTEIQYRLYLLSEYYPIMPKLLQEEHLKRVLAISHQIPKNVNILLKPLPIIKMVAPMKLSSHLEPKVLEVKQNRPQLFIYSPFDKKDETRVQLNWVKNETAQILVEFMNPFRFDLRLKNVSVRFKPEMEPIGGLDSSEPICDVFVHSCLVLSGMTHKVVIATKPRHVGRILLDAVGIEFEDGRFKSPIYIPIASQHLVNEKKEKRSYEIDVIETVPLLNVTLSTPQLSLVEGETTTLFAKLHNTGNCEITFLEITFNNQTSNSVSIKDEIVKKYLPLLPDGDVVTIPIEVVGYWKGSSDIGIINIHIKYGIEGDQYEKAYYREIDLSIKTTVLRALVVEDCITVNETFNKKIVAKIHNYSNSSFMLLSSLTQYLMDEQFDTGIPFGAQSTKMILVDPSILHNINFEQLNIPYTADINQYKGIIAQAMRWKSYVNTQGVVGCKENDEVKQSSKDKTQMRKQTTETSIPSTMNDLINVKQELTAIVNNQHTISHKELAIDQQPVQVSIAEEIEFTASITLSSTNPNQEAFNKIASLIFNIYQDAENGSRIVATNRQFCYSGNLNSCIELVHSNVVRVTLKVFFLERGTFKVSVACCDEQTEDVVLLTSPLEAIIEVRNGLN
ncbi:hypothetical protein FDP41_001357 [Naegleria fowleri]|uniref:Uncharacterized protein n=1 Tax=Naegleria fowleri TaxID=5763 RepID=A0A6A5C330_NAEFO|nr:uncharacterized protein FDP41_001357 [Naegleria fowleri]KAF0979689.1 hypothetical protein FDP41_001357 [Naegleria fowleri]